MDTAIKKLSNGRIGGYGILFSNEDAPDLEGDFFTKESELWLKNIPTTVLLFDHAMNPAPVGENLPIKHVVGKVVKRVVDDWGVWFESVIDESKEYGQYVMKLVEDGKLNYSTDSIAHLVVKEPTAKGSNFVKSWPIPAISLTHHAAEARAHVTPVKGLLTNAEMEKFFPKKKSMSIARKLSYLKTALKHNWNSLRYIDFTALKAKVDTGEASSDVEANLRPIAEELTDLLKMPVEDIVAELVDLAKENQDENEENMFEDELDDGLMEFDELDDSLMEFDELDDSLMEFDEYDDSLMEFDEYDDSLMEFDELDDSLMEFDEYDDGLMEFDELEEAAVMRLKARKSLMRRKAQAAKNAAAKKALARKALARKAAMKKAARKAAEEELDDALMELEEEVYADSALEFDELDDSAMEFDEMTEYEEPDYMTNTMNRKGLNRPGRTVKNFVAKPGGFSINKPTKPQSFSGFVKAIKNKDFNILRPLAAKTSGHYKALGINPDTSGGFLVPPEQSDQIIELLRAEAQLLNMVTTVPLNRDKLEIPKQTGGVSTNWVGENAAISDSDATFGQVTLIAKKLSALVKISNELLMDAGPDVDAFIRDDIAKAMANEIDRVILLGSGVGSQPLGILNIPGVTSTAISSALTYENLVDMVERLETKNVSRSGTWGWVLHPKSKAIIRKIKDSGGQYIFTGSDGIGQQLGGALPANLLDYTWISSTLSGLDSNGRSRIFFGNWSDVIVGQRNTLELMASSEAGSSFENDQTWIRAILRMDVVLRHEESIEVLTAVQ